MFPDDMVPAAALGYRTVFIDRHAEPQGQLEALEVAPAHGLRQAREGRLTGPQTGPLFS